MDCIRYEISTQSFSRYPRPFVFLAGPTVRGHQPHLQPSWRFSAVGEFEKRNFTGSLIIPEFTDLSESDKGREDIPKWEYEGLVTSDVIMFWIPRTRELIGLTTNFELGYWMRERERLVYGRPDDAYRIGYLDILWELDRRSFVPDSGPLPPESIEIYRTLPDTVDAVMRKLVGMGVYK